MSLQFGLPTSGASGPPAAVTLHQAPPGLPSSFGGHGALAAQTPPAETLSQRQEVNISRILRAIERPPTIDTITNQLNEGPRPPLPPLQEEYFTRLLYPDSEDEEPPPTAVQFMQQPRPAQVQLVDYPPPEYHRPHYQLGRPNKNLKPIHVSISQQTVNGLLSLLLLSVISIYGCMGTIFIMSALTVVESLQTRGNCYLVSLAMAHLLVTLLVIPSSALQIMAGDTLNSQRVCHYQWLTLEFSLIVSQLSFMLIAADNYLGYNCSEKVVTQVASFVQGQQQQQQANGDITTIASAASTTRTNPNCERRHLAIIESCCTQGQAPEPGSGTSPVVAAAAAAATKQAPYRTTAQSMQAEFLAQSAQVAARLEKTREQQQQHAGRMAAEAKKQSTLIRRFFNNLPTYLRPTGSTIASQRGLGATTRARVRTKHSGPLAQAQTDDCVTRRESWHLKSSLAGGASKGHHHSAPGGAHRANPEWSADQSADQSAGKSRRLARQFATETGSRLERPGGCLSYRSCCGRLKVLFWIACVWASALAYVLHQHELSFGARFCSTSGSNSYQWGSPPPPPPLSTLASALNASSQRQQLKFQSASTRLSSPVPLPLSGAREVSLRPEASADYRPPSDQQVPADAALHVARPERREQRPGRVHQLVAPIIGGRATREANERARNQEALLLDAHSAPFWRQANGVESLASAAAHSVSASMPRQSERVTPPPPPPSGRQSNPLEWTASTEASSAVSRVDRAEVARGHSSEVASALRGTNRNEQNPTPGTKSSRSSVPMESDLRPGRQTDSDQRSELEREKLPSLLRNRNDETTHSASVIPDVVVGGGGGGGEPRQVQVSRSRRGRDLDCDYAPPPPPPSSSASLRSAGREKSTVGPATKQSDARRANFIIQTHSMEPRNHFAAAASGQLGQRAPTSRGDGAKDDESSSSPSPPSPPSPPSSSSSSSVAVHFDAREPTGGSSSSGVVSDAGERAILHAERTGVERLKDTQRAHSARTVDTRQPTPPTSARLVTKPARAVRWDDDERDDGDDKTQAHTPVGTARTSQDQQQLELIDGLQRGVSALVDGESAAPRWRVESTRQLGRVVSELNAVGHTGESDQQLLVWLPAPSGPQLESRQLDDDDDDDEAKGEEEPLGHERRPQTNNNDRGRDFPRFPPRNDDGELPSSSMSQIGPDKPGGGAQNIDERTKSRRVDGARLASFMGRGTADNALARTDAQIIMHAASGGSRAEPGRARDSLAKLIAAMSAQHSRRQTSKGEQRERGARHTTTTILTDKPDLAARSENNEFEGEKSWPPPSAATERRSSGGGSGGVRASSAPCDSCHRNTRHLETSQSLRLADAKQIASVAQSQTRDRDKFSDGSNNSAAEGGGGGSSSGGHVGSLKVGGQKNERDQEEEEEEEALEGGARQRACDNLNACDKQTIDRDKQRAHASSGRSFGPAPGAHEQPPSAPAPGPQARKLRPLMNNNNYNNNNNKLEMHSNGRGSGNGALRWTNAQSTRELRRRRMQITDGSPLPPRVAGGANLRQARQLDGQLNLNPIDYGARGPAAEVDSAQRFSLEPRQTDGGGGGNSTAANQQQQQPHEHERRRDYFWHMLACAVIAPSLLAALLFARAYIQMKEFKMRPYKPMPAAALNSTPPALLTPRSPIPLIAQRQVYAFDSSAGGTSGCVTAPSNVACVGPSPGDRPTHGGVAHDEVGARSVGGDSRSGLSLATRTEDGDSEEDAGESLARAAQETVRRVSEITSDDSCKRRPLAHHAHSATSEACRSAAVVFPPAPPPRLSQPTTNAASGGKRQVNQVMSAPPPQTTVASGDCYPSSHEPRQPQQQQHYPNNRALPSMSYPPPPLQLHLNGSAPAPWLGAALPFAPDELDTAGACFNHRARPGPGTAASYSAPPSARFPQQLTSGYGFGPELQSQHTIEPSHSSRHHRQRHSSPVAYAARAPNADHVSPIMESPQSFIVGSNQVASPHYRQQQQQQQHDQHHNPLNRHQSHAQSFHYGTAAHHYRTHAARQADAQPQQPFLPPPPQEYRTAQQQRASLQARSAARNRLPLIESSRSSGEAADSTVCGQQSAPAPDHANSAMMSQALANVIRSVDDNGELTIVSYDKQQLSPATAVVPNSTEPSAGSAASSLKRRLAPKPLELAAAANATKSVVNPGKNARDATTDTNTKVILCTYSYMTDDQLLKSNMIVFLVHSAFWLPFVALCISAQYRDAFTGELRDLVWWLAVLNCCSCSYLYALTNKDFREAFHKLFFYCFCQSHVTLQRKTPIFRRQLDVDRKGNLRVHIIPGLNVYSSKLFAASGGLRDGLGNDLSAFAASAHTTGTQHAISRAQQPPAVALAATPLTPNGLAPPVSIAQGH